MQQQLKKIQNSPPLVEYGHPANIAFSPQAISQANWAISTGVVSQTTDLHPVQVYALTSFAEHLAIWLSEALNVLRTYNEAAIYPIISILEPFMETTEELDLDMPPISSTRVILNVTKRGRAEPEFDLE